MCIYTYIYVHIFGNRLAGAHDHGEIDALAKVTLELMLEPIFGMSPILRNVVCVRESEILLEQQPPQEV